MSQLQVTGEAKIRDIQGPVVANSGVITALDGAASQYVRGDGTLADFPTSTGGGSSVSYYLNGSVNQGTFAGSTYYEMSKTPIIGAGTDFAVSTNGLVAQFITDANDPDLLEVPGGNFNLEFYFSVSNNTGNPTVYAELYKYDGTTFTLLGSSQAVPESLNQGTTIAPYYFAIPVGTAALALTDRIAIRIYANVDGRTVTLHTENSHLCQVVTTFSKGMVSLNNLTDQSQFITTGTSGTNFNIVSSGDTHTFNLPVASATNTGKLSSTDWSTFNGKVPYTGAIANVDLGNFNFDANNISGGAIIAKLNGPASSPFVLKSGSSGYTIGDDAISLISSPNVANTLILASNIGVVTKTALIGLGSLTANRTFTLPDASGTLALTSNLSSYVPYTGATANVDLGTFDLTADVITGATGSFSSSGGSDTFAINHSSGSGIALNITKGGNNEGLYINKTSGSGNAATIIGTLNATTLVKSGGTSSQFLMADGSVNTSVLPSGAYLPLTGGTLTGALSGTSATFSGNAAIGAGTQTINGDAELTLRDGVNFVGFDIKSARTSGNLGGIRFFGTSSDSDPVSQILAETDGKLVFYNGSLGASPRLTIASTGAATFSSSVEAVGYRATSSSAFGGTGVGTEIGYSGGLGYIQAYNRGTSTYTPIKVDGSTVSLQISGVERLGIASTGAATFSSSVGVNGVAASYPLYVRTGTNQRARFVDNGGLFQMAVLNDAETAYSDMSLGNSAIVIKSGGNVLIGTTTDESYKLYVNGGSANCGLFYTTSAANQIKASGTAPAITFTNTITSPTIGGTLGAATSANQFLTGTSAGDVVLINNYSGNRVYVVSSSGGVYLTSGATSWTANSDIRLKNINSHIENAVEKLSTLQTINFSYKDDKSNKQNLGLIAQEVEKIFPELVDKNGDDMLGVRYTELVPVLIKAIQELEARIKQLENK